MDERSMGNNFQEPDEPVQSVETIMQILAEATIPAFRAHDPSQFMDGLDLDDDMDDFDSESELDIDSSGEVIYAVR